MELWEQFLRLISENGHLFLKLGHWICPPDQYFPYLRNMESTKVYKWVDRQWVVFGNKKAGAKRYTPMPLTVSHLPTNCIPVQVINSATYLIVLDGYHDSRREMLPIETLHQKQQRKVEKNVLGIYTMDEHREQLLKQEWGTNGMELVCATDGGLKDLMGTSSYAVYFPHDLTPIVFGMAGEYQHWEHASSTRQELLGQLGIKYWMSTFQAKWGTPRHPLKITLITYSKASLDIMESMPRGEGIKAVLQAEMDVALEIYRQRLSHTWILWKFQKVCSHIDKSEAPDEFYWECNEFVDELATQAQTCFQLEELQAREAYVFQGLRVACKIDHRVENNGLYKILKLRIQGRELRQYLMEKYAWDSHIFQALIGQHTLGNCRKSPNIRNQHC